MVTGKLSRRRERIEESLETVMKKIAIVCLCLSGVMLSQMPSEVRAQPVLTNTPSVWTNLLRGTASRNSPLGTALSGTNHTALANAAPLPTAKSNKHSIIRPGQALPTTLPKDVHSLVQQFQQQQNLLLASTGPQRQQLLEQLQQMRDQLQAQAREQALDMRSQFGGNFAPGNVAGGGVTSSGHGGRPRS